MITLMKRLKHKLVQYSALLKERSVSIEFIFVNDTDLTIGKLHLTVSNMEEIIVEMQKAIDIWEGCLKTTDRVIRPDKLFAYVISYWFNSKGEYKYELVKEIEAELLVKNEFGIKERLQMIEPNKGMDTLGVLLAPDGSMKDEFKYLYKKATLWAQDIL